MNAGAAFAAPSPVAVSVHSALSRDEVIKRLAQAIDETPYSIHGRYSPGFFRLGGSVSQDHMTLTARPYVIPGVIAGYGAMTIDMRGEVVESGDGTDVRGTATAPVRRTTLAFLALALITWVAFGFTANGRMSVAWPVLVLLSAFVSAAWAWIIRRNQRMALRNVDEVTQMLTSILADGLGPK